MSTETTKTEKPRKKKTKNKQQKQKTHKLKINKQNQIRLSKNCRQLQKVYVLGIPEEAIFKTIMTENLNQMSDTRPHIQETDNTKQYKCPKRYA